MQNAIVRAKCMSSRQDKAHGRFSTRQEIRTWPFDFLQGGRLALTTEGARLIAVIGAEKNVRTSLTALHNLLSEVPASSPLSENITVSREEAIFAIQEYAARNCHPRGPTHHSTGPARKSRAGR